MTLHVKGDRDLPSPFGIPGGLREQPVCATSGKLPTSLCHKTIREWFIEGRIPSERCEIHKLYRFADENERFIERVFEVFPQEYREWTEEQHMATPPPDAIPVMKLEVKHSDFALLAPQNGQLFKIDPILRKEYQAIRILGHIPPDISDVHVRVNSGKKISYDADGSWWQLQKGEHQFQLEGIRRGRLVRSTSVSIAVD